MSAPIVIGSIATVVVLAVLAVVIWLLVSKSKSKKASGAPEAGSPSSSEGSVTSSASGDAESGSRAPPVSSLANGSSGDSSVAIANIITSSSSSAVTFASAAVIADPIPPPTPTLPPPPPTPTPTPLPPKPLPDVPVAAVVWGNNDQVFATLVNPKVPGYKPARLTSDMKLGFWWGTAGATDCTFRLIYRRPKASSAGSESAFEYGPPSYEARVTSGAWGSPTIYFEFNEDRDVSDISGAQLVLQKLDNKKTGSTFKDQFVFPDASIKGYVYKSSAPSSLAVLSQVRFKIAPAGAT